MFNDLKTNDGTGNNPEVDDIFSDTDKVITPPPVAEGHNTSQQFSGYYANQAVAPTADTADQNIEAQLAGLNNNSAGGNDGGSKKKIVKLVVAVVAFILLIVLGYLVYAKLIVPSSQPTTTDQTNVPLEVNNEIPVITPETNNSANTDALEENTINPPVSEEPNLTPSVPLGTTTPPLANMDSDGDGLSDQQEAILGTNPLRVDSDDDGLSDHEEVVIYLTDPLNPDSDGDGLSDYEEIKIYQTDPLNSDSDNDGYSDKTEIDGGYNPNGPGKLSE